MEAALGRVPPKARKPPENAGGRADGEWFRDVEAFNGMASLQLFGDCGSFFCQGGATQIQVAVGVSWRAAGKRVRREILVTFDPENAFLFARRAEP